MLDEHRPDFGFKEPQLRRRRFGRRNGRGHQKRHCKGQDNYSALHESSSPNQGVGGLGGNRQGASVVSLPFLDAPEQ
jgi:hypothetical protein